MHETRCNMKAVRVLLALCCAAPAIAMAQTYPDKPIKMIVAWPPGGGTDVVGRVVAKHLGDRLKQPVIIENRGGAGGLLGTEFVARAAPNGYTLQYTAADSHSINPHVFKDVRYDALKDFTPVAMVGCMPNGLVVRAGLPVVSVAEFIQQAKVQPGKLTFSTPGMGSGSHIRMESFMAYTKIAMLNVPFQGTGPAFLAIVSGQADSLMVPLGLAEANHRAGKVKVLAVDTPQRYAGLPEVPTFAEQGVSVNFSFWHGILAPAKVSEAIINLLNREANAVLAEAETRNDLLKVGLVAGTPGVNAFGGTPQEVRQFFDSEYVRWGKTIRDAKITAE